MTKNGKSDQAIIVAAGLYLKEKHGVDGTRETHVEGAVDSYRDQFSEHGGCWDQKHRAWVFVGDEALARIASAVRAGPCRPAGLQEKIGKPHYLGHRQRLRDRFMTQGADGLADYELLELLLFYSIARVDVKPLAKKLIARFGGFAGVLAAPPRQLGEVDKVSMQTIVHLKAVHASGLALARAEWADQPILNSWDKLIRYLRANMGAEDTEQFRVLFLNVKNMVIADEIQQRGTINHTPVYPREVIKRALELGATALIMVHNHPSGDPSPSRADIEMTMEVMQAGEKLEIALHDHIVVSKSGNTSFREAGLI